ncbi:universal stress protein [Kitasatospora sp. NPDC048343]|uniref:universal stress protein n=1 Tax=Kitasatospora sp. NPDC048343 TaxID=3154717 RepID=UPI00340FF051
MLAEAQHVLAVRHPELCVHADEVYDVATAALVAAAEDAELLVLAARGDDGFPGLRVGATALHVAGRAGCPVVVVPAEAADPVPREQVVVGVDTRRPAEAALDFAFDAARRYGLPVRALHAWAPVDPSARAKFQLAEHDLLDLAIAPWRAGHPDVQVVADAEPGGAGQVLVDASAKARLVVLGRGHAASLGRLGPVAHAVLHHAACPVVLVPES